MRAEVYDLYFEFDIEQHKAKYINYLEVLIKKDGHVLYAVPSHRELAIRLVLRTKRMDEGRSERGLLA